MLLHLIHKHNLGLYGNNSNDSKYSIGTDKDIFGNRIIMPK